MMRELLSYMRTRLRHFDKLQGVDSANQYFVEPLLTIFEERIFMQAKSNFVQFITLYVIGHIDSPSIGSNAKKACKLFLEKVLSHLIRKAIPESRDESNDLLSRMQAMNYLGSLLSQQTTPIPDATFLKCLQLILEHQSLKQQGGEEHSSRVFQHCFVANLGLIFASRPVLIKQHDYTLYAKVFNIIFHKKWASLEFASPAVLTYIHA